MEILHRKDRFIMTAIEILDELGIQGLSTREIARRQQVSEATLFRHFKNKNDLLVAVLEYFTIFDNDIFESARLKSRDSREAIVFMITSFTEYYENYPAITSILQLYDVLKYIPDLTQKIKDIFMKRSQFLKQLIENAQDSKEIRIDVNSEDLTDMINGLCREICLRWRFENRGFSLKEKTLSALEMLLDSISI